jgi:hypothetical protein
MHRPVQDGGGIIRSPGFAMACFPFLQQIIGVILDQTFDVA